MFVAKVFPLLRDNKEQENRFNLQFFASCAENYENLVSGHEKLAIWRKKTFFIEFYDPKILNLLASRADARRNSM